VIRFFFSLKTSFFRLFEWGRVVWRYYRSAASFVWLDVLLALHYLFRNPHRISKAFLMKKGAKNIYAFGETPLTTLDTIARECRILSDDLVYELGCGSGRTCFWLRTFVKCQVVGVDYLPAFISKANRVKKWARLSKIHFLQEDMLTVDLKGASVIYLYGTCLEDAVIERLLYRFEELKRGTKVITVSYPLTDYNNAYFKLEKSFSARFPWGKADIFLQTRK
jgi:SAM-dependent methyltransferase